MPQMQMKTASGWISALVLAALAMMVVAPARAHGYIVRAIPENRAELDRAPTRLQYWFSEDLEPRFSSITLRDQTGAAIAEGGVDENDRSLMVLRPPRALPDGAYIVELRPAFASDGHVVAESRVFFVGAAIDGVRGAGADDTAIPLEVAWRAVVWASMALLFGVLVLYERVLVPAWGNPKYTSGLLPPRVMTRLFVIAGAAFVFALVGNVLALLQQATVFFNTGLGPVITNGLWNTARIGSRFGEVWSARMIGMIVVGMLLFLSIFWRNDKPRAVRPFWVASMWGVGLIIGSFTVSSHASGSLIMPWSAMAVHWLHTTAIAVWVGGLAALVMVLPVALRPYEGDARRHAMLAAMRQFSGLAVAALLVTVTTGIYNSTNWFYEPNDYGTPYALSLLYKIVLVAGLIALGAVHHIAARPKQYARLQPVFARLGKITLPLEVLIGVGVVALAGLVSATPPPEPGFLQAERPAPRATVTVGGTDLTVQISPGGPGVNTFDVSVPSGVPQAVFVQNVRPDADIRGDWQLAELIEPGVYVTATDDIDAGGRWLTLVDAIGADDGLTRAVFEWDIDPAASVIETVPPDWTTWASLVGVLAALAVAVRPWWRMFARRLNLNTVTVTIMLLGTLATAGVVYGGFVFIADLEQQYLLAETPPPPVVNPILPDTASLERGAQAYAEACDWAGDGRVLNSIVERLPRTRDFELYAMTLDGWRTLPPCAGLSDDARWDVVNYVRTLEVREGT